MIHSVHAREELVKKALASAPTTLVTLTSAEGAGEHTHAGALGRAHQAMFDWLDTTLAAWPAVQANRRRRRRMMVIGLRERISAHASRVRVLDRIITRLRDHDDVWRPARILGWWPGRLAVVFFSAAGSAGGRMSPGGAVPRVPGGCPFFWRGVMAGASRVRGCRAD
jgi:hypothetical protein